MLADGAAGAVSSGSVGSSNNTGSLNNELVHKMHNVPGAVDTLCDGTDIFWCRE